VPDGPVGPDTYPDNVNPLTGLIMDDPTVLQRRPLAIKVSNAPLARPQSGLNAADIVFEHYVEGGGTRYTAIMYGNTISEIGSLRSGRLPDLEIVPMLDAIYVASGFSSGVLERMRDANWRSRNFSSPFGYEDEPYMVRVQREGRAYEHTLYSVPDELWKLAETQNVNQPPDLTPGLAFWSDIQPNGTPATTVTINYFPVGYTVRWEYNPDTGRYYRWQDGEPDIDLLTGAQIAADNIIAVGAIHVDTGIVEDVFGGLWSIEVQIWGDGPASLFRDGQRYEGGWTRTNPEEMLLFTDLDGNILYFKPGQTWVEMVPIGFDQLFTEP